MSDRLIERYYGELRGFAYAMLERARERGKNVKELRVYWPEQAPHQARIYTLRASVHAGGKYHQLVEGDAVSLEVDFPSDGIRKLFRSHPEARGFFINAHPHDVEPDEVKSGVKRLTRWFASKDPFLPSGHGDDVDPAYEFDWAIFLMIDACIEHLERDLKKDPELKKAGLVLTGDDGFRNPARWDCAKIAELRKRNGYRPSQSFLKEYLSLFSSSPKLVAAWAAALAKLPAKLPATPHPLGDLPAPVRQRLMRA